MFDIVEQVDAAHRAIGDDPLHDGAKGRSVVIRRTYTVRDVPLQPRRVLTKPLPRRLRCAAGFSSGGV